MTSLDKLTIDTPEQLSLDFPLAGIGSRFLALAIDTLIQVVIGFALVMLGTIVYAFGLISSGPTAGLWIIAIWILLGFALQFGYFAIFESIWNGQTPGKRRLQLRVIKDDGRPITVYDAVARNLLRIVDSLPGIYGVGILCALLNKQNKRLGDFVAGTVVVHEKKLEGMQPVWDAPAPHAAASGTAGAPVASGAGLSVGRLSSAEAQLVEAFLDRRASLDPGVRSQAASSIADRIAQTLEVPREQRHSAEKFLEEVLTQRRNLGG